ncbi:DUF5643 domain-containing protein, partial [Paenibacillus riograndensis]
KIKFTTGSFGDLPGQRNAFIGEMTHGLNLPDKFELTIQTKVTNVEEPFEFKVPVKVDNNALVLKPDVTKSDGQFSYTVKELYLSPVSTRLVVDSQGPVPQSPEQTGDYSASKVYYEIVDDQGNELDQRMLGFFNGKPATEYHIDDLYSPFAGKPKSITIKPFTFTVKNADWSIVGEKKDSKGNYVTGKDRLGNDSWKDSMGTRTYLKDLEVTIPVNP